MDAWQRYLDLASGLTEVTRKGAESVVRALVKQGEVAADRAERVVDDLLERSEANRKLVGAIVRSETEKAVARLGVAQQTDLDRLRREVEQLRGRVDALSAMADAPATAAGESEQTTARGSAAPAATSTGSKPTRKTAAQRRAASTSAAASSGQTPNPASPEDEE